MVCDLGNLGRHRFSTRKSVHIRFVVLSDVIFFVLFHGDFPIYFLTRLVVNKTIGLYYYLMVQHV